MIRCRLLLKIVLYALYCCMISYLGLKLLCHMVNIHWNNSKHQNAPPKLLYHLPFVTGLCKNSSCPMSLSILNHCKPLSGLVHVQYYLIICYLEFPYSIMRLNIVFYVHLCIFKEVPAFKSLWMFYWDFSFSELQLQIFHVNSN